MSLESFSGPREYPSAAVHMTEARRLEVLSELMVEQSRINLAIQTHQAYMNTTYTSRETAPQALQPLATPAPPVRRRRRTGNAVERQAADVVDDVDEEEEI